MINTSTGKRHHGWCVLFGFFPYARYLLFTLLAWAIILPIGLFLFTADAHPSTPANVLLIDAYHPGYRWSDQVVSGIRETLMVSSLKPRLYMEHLDSKRIYSPPVFDRLADLIREKYRSVSLDVIIVADNNSVNFLKTHRQSLFPGIPVVYCGINDLNPADLVDLRPITGVNEAADVCETIDLALALMPSTRRIVVVNDTTPTGKNVHREILGMAAAFNDRLRFVFWEDIPREDLLRWLTGLKPGDLVLYTFFFRDRAGRFYEYDDSPQRICNASPVPVFGLWEFNLGQGILGGKLSSGFEQGREAGEMALRIINGEKAADIPPLMKSPNRYAFDYRVLKKFGIHERRLPAGSLVVNRPTSTYQKHKPAIWIGLITIATLTLLSLFLLAYIVKRKRMENDLRENQQFVLGITRNVPGAVCQFFSTADGEFGFNFVSDKAFEIFELDASVETFFTTFSKRVHDDDRERFLSSITEAVENVCPWHFEGRFVKPSGEVIWFSGNSVPHRDVRSIVFDGVIMDISDLKAAEDKLHKSERQMSQIIDFLPDPTFVIDRESRVIAWNRAMVELTGINAEAMLGKGDYEYALPFWGERRPVMIDLVGHWTDEIAGKYKNIKKAGSLLFSETLDAQQLVGNRYYKNTAGPLYDENGSIVGAIETIHDITAQRATETALLESETLLRLFVKYTPAAVAMCDTRMNYLAYSRRWLTDYHLPDEDLRGRCHYDVFEVIPEHWKKEHQRCFRGEVVEGDEEPFTRADGTRDWVRRSLHPWRIPSGEIGGLIMFTEVVTHKKQAEENLHLMERVLNNSPAVLFRWKPVEGWPVAFVTDNVSQFGYLPEDLLSGSLPFTALVHPEDLPLLAKEMMVYAQQGVADFKQEYRILTKAGDVRWVDIRTMAERDSDGNIIHNQGVVLDITDRKKAQEGAHQRQMFLESVLYHAPDAVITLDKQHRVLDWNPGAEKIFGYTQEDAFGNELDRLVSRNEVEWEANLKTRSVLSGKRVEAFETVRYRKDGTPVNVIAAGSPIIVDGTLTGVVAVYTDITALKRAEDEVRKNERMLRLVLDTIPVRVFWKDRELHYLGCNQPFAEDAGTSSPDKLVGQDDYAFSWGSDQAEEFRRDDRAVIDSGESRINYEESLTTPDGGTIWLQTSKVPIRDRQENIIGVLGTYQDITERKHALEELRRLRNFLTNIINSMPSVLVGVDIQGRVTQWNKQAELATGLTFENARLQPLTTVFPPLIDHMAAINAAIKDRRVIRDSKILRYKQGETRFEEVTIFPLVANDVEGAVIRVDDVTERVRLEEMMIQSEKMLSVGGLAAGMAHEINNPLAGIMQNTAVLENRLLGNLPANHNAAEVAGTTMEAIGRYLELRKLPNMLENIRSSGNRAAGIVKNMLSFARKSEHVVSSHDLGVLLDQTIALAQTDYDMKNHFDFKQIHIFRDYDAGAPPVPCEASKLQQVFLNIIKNGAEAMGDVADGQPTPSFTLRVKEDGPWVRVDIADNGPGLDEKTRRRIFEPFYTTKPVGKGTGLGLSVSYFIITENHGGKMDVFSEKGQGTRFVVRLPKTGTS